MDHKKKLTGALLAWLCWCHAAYAADPQTQTAPTPPVRPEPRLSKSMNEQVVMVSSGTGMFGVQLETTIFKPDGPGPFPIVMMNHGKSLGPPSQQPRSRDIVIAREFLHRGYAVVLPMRRGFSKSTGQFIGGTCNTTENGIAQANDLQSALNYVLAQPWADKDKVVVMGQSHGGLSTMAFGARNPAHVKALVNFAGGLRYNLPSCDWKPALVEAFTVYGKTARLPSVWFYGANDSYFAPELVRQMYAAYTKSGADAKLIAFGPFKNDAHGMSGSREGVPIWWPETEALLKRVGLPTANIIALSDEPAGTNFARLDDDTAVPYVKQDGRIGYDRFLQAPLPRAFAISESGRWVIASGGESPVEVALDVCQKRADAPCSIYAVDQNVVWVDKGRHAQGGSDKTAAMH